MKTLCAVFAATPKRASAEVKKTAKQPPAAARSPSIPSGTTPSGVGIGELTQTLQGLRAPTHLVPTPSPKGMCVLLGVALLIATLRDARPGASLYPHNCKAYGLTRPAAPTKPAFVFLS